MKCSLVSATLKYFRWLICVLFSQQVNGYSWIMLFFIFLRILHFLPIWQMKRKSCLNSWLNKSLSLFKYYFLKDYAYLKYNHCPLIRITKWVGWILSYTKNKHVPFLLDISLHIGCNNCQRCFNFESRNI